MGGWGDKTSTWEPPAWGRPLTFPAPVPPAPARAWRVPPLHGRGFPAGPCRHGRKLSGTLRSQAQSGSLRRLWVILRGCWLWPSEVLEALLATGLLSWASTAGMVGTARATCGMEPTRPTGAAERSPQSQAEEPQESLGEPSCPHWEGRGVSWTSWSCWTADAPCYQCRRRGWGRDTRPALQLSLWAERKPTDGLAVGKGIHC